MGKFIVFILIMLLATSVYAAPSTTISIPNTFVAGTTIQSGQTNANNNEIQNKYNSHTHTDLTQVGTITAGTWGGSAITTQFGGTGSDFSASASGALIVFNGTGTTTSLAKGASGSLLVVDSATSTPQWLSQGTKNQVLQSNGANTNPSWTSAGKVAQVVNNSTGAVLTTTDQFTLNNNIPSNATLTKDLILATITPTASANSIRVDVDLQHEGSGGGRQLVAIFQDAGANAVATTYQYRAAAEEGHQSLTFMSTGNVVGVPTTYRLRMASDGASTITINGVGGAAKLGGSMRSGITLTEIAP